MSQLAFGEETSGITLFYQFSKLQSGQGSFVAMDLAQAPNMWQNYNKIMPHLMSDKQPKQNTVNVSKTLLGKAHTLRVFQGHRRWWNMGLQVWPSNKVTVLSGEQSISSMPGETRQFVPVWPICWLFCFTGMKVYTINSFHRDIPRTSIIMQMFYSIYRKICGGNSPRSGPLEIGFSATTKCLLNLFCLCRNF